MVKSGMRVRRLTKKVGQAAPTGTVEALRGADSVEVRWDDGRTSIVTRDAVEPEHRARSN